MHLAGVGAGARVVLLFAADHLGDRAQHGDVGRGGFAAQRGRAPQADEPGEPRVLDHQLSSVVGELRLEPVGQPCPQRAPRRQLAGLEPRTRPGVTDLNVAAAEQLVVQVDDPLRFAEALGVGLVGLHLGLGHVHAQGLEGAGHGAGAAAAGADDKHDPPLQRGAVLGGQLGVVVELGHGRQPSHAASGVCGARWSRQARPAKWAGSR